MAVHLPIIYSDRWKTQKVSKEWKRQVMCMEGN